MTPHDLRAWRARMGWTQRELALALGRTVSWVSKAERGGCAVDRVLELACAALEAGLDPAGTDMPRAPAGSVLIPVRREDIEAALRIEHAPADKA